MSVTLQARAAGAQPQLTVELDYSTDPALVDCPEDATFRTRVNEQVGYEPFRQAAPLRVVTRADAAPTGTRGSVVWYDSAGALLGERQLQSKRCQDLVEAMAFAVSVQIQLFTAQQQELEQPEQPPRPLPEATPSAEPLPAPQPPAPAPARAPQPELDVPPPSRSATSERSAPAWTTLLGAGAALRVRSDRSTGSEARLYGAHNRGAIGGELALGVTFPDKWRDSSGAGFTYWSLWGALAACAAAAPVGGCLDVRLERLMARGTGVDEPRAAAAWLVELGPRVVLFTPHSTVWRASVYLEARAQLAPARVLENDARVWKSPPWSITVGVDAAALWSVR